MTVLITTLPTLGSQKSGSNHDVNQLASDLNKIQISDLIKSNASPSTVTHRTAVSNDSLIAGVDWVGRNITQCIELAETVLQRPSHYPQA